MGGGRRRRCHRSGVNRITGASFHTAVLLLQLMPGHGLRAERERQVDGGGPIDPGEPERLVLFKKTNLEQRWAFGARF